MSSSYDAWVTREPDAPDPILPGDDRWPRCTNCGGWLKGAPDRRVAKEQIEECDGKPLVATYVYTRKDDAAALDVIGWDKLGEPYVCEWPPMCGLEGSHEPHAVVVHAWDEIHRTCSRCGADNVEVDA